LTTLKIAQKHRAKGLAIETIVVSVRVRVSPNPHVDPLIP